MTAENQTKTFISPEDLLNNYLGMKVNMTNLKNL